MAENGHLVAYLLVEKGTGENKKTYWRPLGAAYPCRDGSINLKLDIHPGLTFNLRPPKSNGEREEAKASEEDDEENDRTFSCTDCVAETLNEDAHLLFDEGAVCRVCADVYRACGRCGLYFPKVIEGTHCPNCGGENV